MTTSGENGGSDVMLKTVLYLPEGSRRHAAVVERLSEAGVSVTTPGTVPEALRFLGARPFALCLMDLAAERPPVAAIRALRAQHPHVALAGLFNPANPLAAAEAISAGALDVLPWPFETRDLATLLANARDLQPVAVTDQDEADDADSLVAQSPAMQRVSELIAQAAAQRLGVCVSGEPGTGRTLVGRTIHRIGDTARVRPFVTDDCASAPQDLERRLFGLTAAAPKAAPAASGTEQIGPAGALYLARGGTLLLRNLVDAPARVQARLARVLRDREALLVNGKRTIVDLDIQPIATLDTGVDVALSEGRLRRDLYKQVAQVRIDMPALRRRREDIPLLAVQVLRQMCQQRQVPVKSFSRSVLQVMMALPWNGNATELTSLLETLIDTVDGPVIQLEHLLEHATLDGVAEPVEAGATLRDAKARFERDCISAVLMRHHGRVPEAAKALGIQRTNLYRKIRQLNVARSLLSARR
jgi:DNA-binding NtrC family response regulator